ncbi:MAG: lipopolysaccharide biosynthesis protein, partial [Sphingomonadaceae bacterium]
MEPASVTSRHVAKGVGTTLLARIGGVIEVISQPLYVWMFGLASFGLYTVLWAAINLAENILDLGMTSAMQRTVPQARDQQEAARSLRAALILGVGPNILAAILGSIFAPQIAPWLNVAAGDQPLVVPAIQLFVWALPLWAL